jgi:hypothetical protein
MKILQKLGIQKELIDFANFHIGQKQNIKILKDIIDDAGFLEAGGKEP